MTTTLTPARVAEMAAKATPGPWCADGFDIMAPRQRDVVTLYSGGVEHESRSHNAALIAAAPDMATLIAKQEAEIERLRSMVTALCDVFAWCDLDPVDRGYSSMADEVAMARTALEAKP